MYVTRPLSLYRKNPSSLSLPPPEGPNSGYLVIQDEESDITCCFGLCKDHQVYNLPIPQNKNLTIQHVNGTSGENRTVSNYYVMLFPVLNQPVSSGRYYAIKTSGRHKGEAYINSKEEDMGTCCFCNFIRDEKARLFDSRNIHHQFEISIHQTIFSKHGKFLAKSVAPNGFPPYFLRRKGWKLYASTPKNYELGEAAGLDSALRARLPEFNFPLSYRSSETVEVGKWYSPFIFIRDGTLRDQVKKSMYYEVTLEQRWEQIFACENNYGEDSNVVVVDVLVQREDVLVAGREIVHEREVVDGVVWFRSHYTKKSYLPRIISHGWFNRGSYKRRSRASSPSLADAIDLRPGPKLVLSISYIPMKLAITEPSSVAFSSNARVPAPTLAVSPSFGHGRLYRMDYGEWTNNSRGTYNKWDGIARSTIQVFPGAWTSILVSLDNVGIWNLRTENLDSWYLGQETYVRVVNPEATNKTELPIPENALFCGALDKMQKPQEISLGTLITGNRLFTLMMMICSVIFIFQ